MQLPVIAVVAEQQGAEVRAAPAGFAPSDHDEFLAFEALRLQPQAAIAGGVWAVDALRDDAFNAQLTRLSVEARAVRIYRVLRGSRVDYRTVIW